jgi:DNA-binding IscR family transcriptional regulator
VASEPARDVLHPSTGAADEPLGERAQMVLIAMSEMGLVDSDHRRSTEDIAAKALGSGADANSLKNVMLELKTLQMIDSKTGRGGGCWLTEKGRDRAEKLRNQ